MYLHQMPFGLRNEHSLHYVAGKDMERNLHFQLLHEMILELRAFLCRPGHAEEHNKPSQII